MTSAEMTTLEKLKAFFTAEHAQFARFLRGHGQEMCTAEVRELVAEVERLNRELHEATHAVDGKILVYRVTGSTLEREPVADLLVEFNNRGTRIGELQARVAELEAEAGWSTAYELARNEQLEQLEKLIEQLTDDSARLREREPLVQELLREIAATKFGSGWESLLRAAEAVREHDRNRRCRHRTLDASGDR